MLNLIHEQAIRRQELMRQAEKERLASEARRKNPNHEHAIRDLFIITNQSAQPKAAK